MKFKIGSILKHNNNLYVILSVDAHYDWVRVVNVFNGTKIVRFGGFHPESVFAENFEILS